ncbi:MAG TPA: PrsW family intramembrane metalloprotease [Planctomycetota bacterium]|nr:PrsW family intramembrane metalloprotease [Planctomycetota bacterium]
MSQFSTSAGVPVFRPKESGHASLIKWILIGIAAMVALLFGSLLLLLFGASNGLFGLIFGIVAATLPVPIYMTLLLWLDRFEPEPPWLLAVAFFWGALVATFAAVIGNSVMGIVASKLFDPETGQKLTLSFSAPFFEESFKAMILFIIFFWRKADFDGILDGIIYAGMVALGFAMTENIEYYGNPNFAKVPTLIMRGIFSPFAHPLFTSMTGIGLGISRESKNKFIKVVAPLCGLALAMLLHFTWNTSTYAGQYLAEKQEEKVQSQVLLMLGTYFLFMVPAFFGLLGVVGFALFREGRMIRRNLAPELASGALTAGEVKTLGSVFGRLYASGNALTRSGFAAWKARRRFHEAASQLAFHRNRIANGTVEVNADSSAHEAELLEYLIDRKRRL